MRRLGLLTRRRSGDEDGVVLVLLAVGLVVFLGVAAVAIDLGVAYASSRQMQNAADAAAMAGTQELECLKFMPSSNTVGCKVYPATAAAVASVVTSTATTDGADASQLTCNVISGYVPGSTPDYQVIGSCSDPSSWVPFLNTSNAAGQQADGIYVETGTTEHAIFGGSTGVRNLTQQRQAAATVQGLAGTTAPLYACAINQTDQVSGTAFNLLKPSGSSSTGYVVNSQALYNNGAGPVFDLHDNHVDNCGLTSDGWKGVSDGAAAWPTLPGWLPIKTGVTAGPIRVKIANEPGCTSDGNGNVGGQTGCVLILPVCVSSDGGSGTNGNLYCVGFGAFQLVSSTANSQDFGFVGLANATGGITGQGNPDPNGVNVVTLVQ